MEPIVITAVLKAKSGHEKELEQALLAVLQPSREEEGCIQYDLHQSTDDPSVFVFYERWANEAALNAHIHSDHYGHYRQHAEELVETREVYRLRLATGHH
ncbi:putative quinol monooxygenase [Paenibacillus sp. JSM ZJ436]|uniref:putative quinol monooxygenase n=1 Tax=Paenibacillus sp. JSM ZJ436 TaxID=3376190 RepID=UPI00379A70F4